GALVLGVADGALEDRLQQPGALVGQELEQLQRLVHRPVADQRGERPNLARRHVGVAVDGSVFHNSVSQTRRVKFRGQDLNLRPRFYAPGELPLLPPGIFLSLARGGRPPRRSPGSYFFPLPPLWPLKMRVGENSPSLWPTMSSVTYS